MRPRWTGLVVAVWGCLALGCMLEREIGRRRGPLPAGGAPTPGSAPVVMPSSAPAPLPGDPCCTVRGLDVLNQPGRLGSPPQIAHNGKDWTVAWSDFDGRTPVSTPTLHSTARPATDPRWALAQWPGYLMADLAFAPDLPLVPHAVLLTPYSRSLNNETASVLALLDPAGAVQRSVKMSRAMGGGGLTRVPALASWAVLLYDDLDGGRHGDVRLMLYDDGLALLGPGRALGSALNADFNSVEVVAVGEQVVTVFATEAGIQIRTFVGRTLNEPQPALSLPAGSYKDPNPTVGRNGLPLEPGEKPVAALGAGRLRDTVVVAAMNHLRVRTWVYRPADHRLLAGPTAVASSYGYRTPGVAGDDVSGIAGICFPDHDVASKTADADALGFITVGLDGGARGQPVTIAQGLRYVAACDVAAAIDKPNDFLVALWNAGHAGEFPSIIATRVHEQPPALPVIE